MSTWFAWAILMIPRFLVCEYCPSNAGITVSSFSGFVFLRKWRKHWVRSSLYIHSEGWQMYTDASGVPFIISSFIFFCGNKRSGGMRCPVGIIQVTIVTNKSFFFFCYWREKSDVCRVFVKVWCVYAVQQWSQSRRVVKTRRIMVNYDHTVC